MVSDEERNYEEMGGRVQTWELSCRKVTWNCTTEGCQ